MWNANWRVNEKLSDHENRFLPCRAIFIIKMRIIILLYIPFSAGLCNLQLIQSNRKIKDIFWIKTKALSTLPAVTVYYILCSSEEAKKWLSRELRVAFPTYFLGEGSRYKPILPWTPSRRPHSVSTEALCAADLREQRWHRPLQGLCSLCFLTYPMLKKLSCWAEGQDVAHCWMEVSHGRQGPTNSPAFKQRVWTELSSSTTLAVLTCTALCAYAAFKRKAIARDTFKKLLTNL